MSLAGQEHSAVTPPPDPTHDKPCLCASCSAEPTYRVEMTTRPGAARVVVVHGAEFAVARGIADGLRASYPMGDAYLVDEATGAETWVGPRPVVTGVSPWAGDDDGCGIGPVSDRADWITDGMADGAVRITRESERRIFPPCPACGRPMRPGALAEVHGGCFGEDR